MKIVGWFSCGNNSAVMSKLLVDRYASEHELKLVRCVVNNEHADNDRFHSDVEAWIKYPIERHRSSEYQDCWDVWERRRYISGVRGAPCTIELKKAVRWQLEKEWQPDYQAFGFSIDEAKRSERFLAQNPDIRLLRPLEDHHITKPDCKLLVEAAGIELPVMYKLGFTNNNCIGCAKATSVFYWARVRHFFPNEFERMSLLSRRLKVRLTRYKGERIFLDEIPVSIDWQKKDRTKEIECGVLCSSE